MNTIHVAIGVVVGDDKKILLTQRFDPENPSVHLRWQLPGGGIEKNETAIIACIRELKEETGLVVEIQSGPSIIENIYNKRRYILHGFRVKTISGTIDVRNDIETADAKWFEPHEIKKLKTLKGTLDMINSCINN